jgi:hypothetical protein
MAERQVIIGGLNCFIAISIVMATTTPDQVLIRILERLKGDRKPSEENLPAGQQENRPWYWGKASGASMNNSLPLVSWRKPNLTKSILTHEADR